MSYLVTLQLSLIVSTNASDQAKAAIDALQVLQAYICPCDRFEVASLAVDEITKA